MSNFHNRLRDRKVLLEFETLSSTNTFALELLAEKDPVEGTVVWAHHQSDGRGQLGTKWESVGGKNLTFSIILYPNFLLASDQFYLNKGVSTALVRVFGPFFQERIRVKWPNDIYIDQEKVAGILIQNQVRGQHLRASVIGIGLNVNQMAFSTSLPNATSLALHGYPMTDLELILHEIVAQIMAHYLQLKENITIFDPEYSDRLYKYHEKTTFHMTDRQAITGYIQGVDSRGRLEVKLVSGERRFFNIKEIRYR